jgi:hypothetical protein
MCADSKRYGGSAAAGVRGARRVTPVRVSCILKQKLKTGTTARTTLGRRGGILVFGKIEFW